MILLPLVLVYACALIFSANLEEHRKASFSLTALMTCGLANFDGLWKAAEALISRLSPFERPAFDSRRPVHRVAGLLLIMQVMWLVGYLLAGNEGIPGVRLAADRSGALLQFATAAATYVTLALLGLGWGIRRGWRAVMRRLSLRLPTRFDFITGLLMAIMLYGAATIATALWQSGLPTDMFESQTSAASQIFDAFKDSLPAGLLLALLAATGEEILFRGALQPVFGLFISSVFFTAFHLQYAFTPAALILFVVSLGFGLLRKRIGTTAAIIAHTAYNLLPFLLFGMIPA